MKKYRLTGWSGVTVTLYVRYVETEQESTVGCESGHGPCVV